MVRRDLARLVWRAVRRGLAVGCLMMLLAGCGDLSILAPREPVTIRFVYAGEAAYYQPLIEEFQQQE